MFAQSVDIDSGHTYLLRAGLWEHGLKQGPRLLERYSKARPYGPINSSAKKLKPVQLALMLMAQVEGELEGLCPHISVEMGLCPHISVEMGLCPHISVEMGLCPHISVEMGLCPHISVEMGLCSHISVEMGLFINK